MQSIEISEEAYNIVQILHDKYGKLIFHHSGGCCEGSAPLCFKDGEFYISKQDILCGFILDCPMYIANFHFQVWKHTKIELDVVKGGAGFSLEIPLGVRFIIKSHNCIIKNKELESK